ncbi:MAG: hypothetical protein AAB573_03005 [Patescibacteria group bacterium]
MKKENKLEIKTLETVQLIRGTKYHYSDKDGTHETSYVFLADSRGNRVTDHEYASIDVYPAPGLGSVYVGYRGGRERVLKWNTSKKKFVEVTFPGGFGDRIPELEREISEDMQGIERQRETINERPKEGASKADRIKLEGEKQSARESIAHYERDIAANRKKIRRERIKRAFFSWTNEVFDITMEVPDHQTEGYVKGDTTPKIIGKRPYYLRAFYKKEKGVLCTVEQAVSPIEYVHGRIYDKPIKV